MSSAMDLDKPLDEIIKAQPKARRGRGGSTRPASRAPAGRPGPTTRPPPAAKPVTGEAIKIIISNLPSDVTEAAVRDLMQSTVGPVKSVQMSYNASGKSIGAATVLFRKRGDGNKAYTMYHNRIIDGQRPMRVEIALDPAQLVSLASRVSGKAPADPAARAPRAARGGRGGKAPRPARKTAEELDADMVAYKDSN